MPFVSYFAARSKNKEITASDVAQLVLESTITHNAGGAPLAHPPHPHAHISKEGFTQDFRPLTGSEQKRMNTLAGLGVRTKQEQAEHDDLANRAGPKKSAFDIEGRHLDPATRGTYSDLSQEVVDPAKGPYTNRKFHSQFQDSEIAILALYHALNTDAGQDALAYLAKTPGGRAVLTSLSAAGALNQGPLKVSLPPRTIGQILGLSPPTQLSVHPDRNKNAEVVLRGQGGAGAAAAAKKGAKVYPATAPITAVVSVLDNHAGELVLTTHYPTDTAPDVPAVDAKNNLLTKPNKKGVLVNYNVPAADDYSELSDSPVKAAVKFYAVHKFAQAVFKAQPKVTWSTKRPTIMRCAVNSSGLACGICGTVHGATPSLFNKWFQCASCGTSYCPTHSGGLVAAAVKKGEVPGKKCQSPNCATGVARWVY